MTQDVKQYVKNCIICRQVKYSTHPLAGLMQPLPVPQHIWQDIAMDFIIELPLSHGCSVILVVMDRLTKFAYFILLQQILQQRWFHTQLYLILVDFGSICLIDRGLNWQ